MHKRHTYTTVCGIAVAHVVVPRVTSQSGGHLRYLPEQAQALAIFTRSDVTTATRAMYPRLLTSRATLGLDTLQAMEPDPTHA